MSGDVLPLAAEFSALESLQTPFPLLESKLAPPRLRDGTIPRPELVGRLRPKPPANVSLVVAPAGYGKTTLLAQLFAHVERQPIAWLSVDERDDDPVTLLTYLTLALHHIGVCDRGLVDVLARPRRSLTAVLARLQRSLQASGPFTLLVDDLHLLADEQSFAIVRQIVRDLPPTARVVLTSRIELPLPLSELRAAGRIVRFGIDEIRLSEKEVRLLLRSTGLAVSDEEVADMTERTEGWPAGVYLAALVKVARSDDAPITAFRGSDRFVSDYIHFEHLAYLPEEDQEFLVRASALDRLSGPLCDAALHRSRSASKLEELAQSNLFIIPVHAARPRTYRFQNLFREALDAELRRSDPGLAETIAARASTWCETRGDVESAIEYASAAGDRDRFAELVERFVMPLYYGGRFATIARWFALLDDDELLERHPALAATGAYVLGLEGRDDDALRWAEIAERAPADAVMPDGSPARAWVAKNGAAFGQSGVGRMREDAELALSALAPGSSLYPSALFYLGTARLLAGESAVADEILADAYAAATAANMVDLGACALAERSLVAGAAGRWDDADDLAVQAREALQDAHLDDTVKSALTYAASARAACRNGDWVRARDDLARAESLAPPAGALAFPWFTAQVRLETTRVRMELSDAAGASATLAQVRAALAAGPDLGVLHAQADELAADLESRLGVTERGEHLTPAELRLLPLLTTHLTFREIAEHLEVSRNTVKTQAICTYRKLGASSRSEAIRRATELGLVERSEVFELSRRR
jgi:LuxR family maltose regulon positive regulatory protein